MDTAQDLCVLIKAPLRKLDDKVFMEEAHVIADTVASEQTEFSVYREFIQAKLDSLRYDEETIGWMESHLKLVPQGKADLRLQAKRFLRSLLKLFDDDNPIGVAKVFHDPQYCFGEEIEPWIELETVDDPITIAEALSATSSDQVEGIEVGEESEKNESRNSWNKRLSRYFAYCVDGGILGTKYTLRDLVESKGGLTSENGKKVQKCIEWMLHMRLKDMSRPFFEVSITQQLRELDGWEFNDRVMIVLIETDYLRKLFGRKEADYSACISSLLTKPDGSNTLKSAVCKLLIQTVSYSPEQFLEDVSLPLLDLLKGDSIFLQTWATAALVNLTASQNSIKNLLMGAGVAQHCVAKLKTRDDDLIQWTLTLMVNLSKYTHHRSVIASYGAITIFIDLLTSSYHNTFKNRMLTQLCSVIGQFAEDEEYRKLITSQYAQSINCLLLLFDNAKITSPLHSKIIFCLKQLCKGSYDVQNKVGSHCIKKLLADMKANSVKLHSEFLMHAILFLIQLVTAENALLMNNVGLNDVMRGIVENPDFEENPQFQNKIQSLLENVRDLTHRDEI